MITYETCKPFREIADAAVRNERATGFPASVLLAMAACESGWFEKLTGDRNYFGITRYPEDGPAKLCLTHEDLLPQQLTEFRWDERKTAIRGEPVGGGRYRYSMYRWFASFSSLDESVLAYTEFFTKSPHRYSAAWSQYTEDHNELALLKRICESGYATGSAEKIEISIEQQSNIVHAIQMTRLTA